MNNEKVKGKFNRTIAGCLETSGFWFKIQAPAEILPKAERSYVEDKMFMRNAAFGAKDNVSRQPEGTDS
jgi:hypothetical protein